MVTRDKMRHVAAQAKEWGEASLHAAGLTFVILFLLYGAVTALVHMSQQPVAVAVLCGSWTIGIVVLMAARKIAERPVQVTVMARETNHFGMEMTNVSLTVMPDPDVTRALANKVHESNNPPPKPPNVTGSGSA